MGKSLRGKEPGKNISQRKDGRYQARFINRFGQRQTIYAKTLNEIRARLREEQYNDVKEVNVVSKGKMPVKGYENLVFVTRNNRPTQQFIIQECMNLIIQRIQKVNENFETFTPHTFRHSFATWVIENGMQPKVLSKLLGHGQLQITMD